MDSNNSCLVSMESISLSFGTVRALNRLSLEILPGEVHAVVGEHGAGKSSLAHLFAGVHTPTEGHIRVKGNLCRQWGIQEARKKGIALVSQHTLLCENLSIAKNIYMNQLSFQKQKHFSRRKVYKNIKVFLKKYDIKLPMEKRARELFLAEKVFIDILRQVYLAPRLLILDEALEKLTASQLLRILTILEELKNRGSSILYITHRVDDIYRFADRVTVIRQGELLITESVKDIDKFNLIKMAYTQFPGEQEVPWANKEFYNLLKYNQAILETLPVNLLVIDTEKRVKLINRQAAVFFKLKPINPVLVNHRLEELFQENMSLYKKLIAALELNEDFSLLDEPFHVAQERRITRINLIPIRDGSWRIGTIIMLDDVTSQVKLREQIFFSEKLASIGILAAGVAHEINNPLEIIQNNIDYLKAITSNEDSTDVLKEIGEEINSMSQIVGNLTDVAKEQGQRKNPICFNDMIDSVVKLTKPYATQRQTTLNMTLPEIPLIIEVNKTEIRQILLNILKNSFEAMEEGGTINISLSAPGIHVDKPLAILRVEDDGPGFSSKNPDDIFLPFYSTKKGNMSNMGLGLYMTYKLTKQNNGSIKAENLTPGGCAFTLEFPLII